MSNDSAGQPLLVFVQNGRKWSKWLTAYAPCVQIVKHDGILLSSIQEGLKPSYFCSFSKADQSCSVEHIPTHPGRRLQKRREEEQAKALEVANVCEPLHVLWKRITD